MFADLLSFLMPAFLILEGICYLAAVIQTMRRRVGRGNAAPLLSLYAVGGFALALAESLQGAERLPFAGGEAFARLQLYGALALSVLMVYVVRAFFRMRKRAGLIWLGAGLFFALALALLDSGLLPLPAILWTDGTYALPSSRLDIGVAIGGWVLFTTASILTVWIAMRRIRQPLHRNRASYWLPIFLFLALNDTLVILSGQSWSGVFRLLAVLLIAYILTRHRLPDMRQILRRVFAFITGIALLLLAYLAFVFLGTLVMRLGVSDNSLLVGAALVLLLAAVFIPLFVLLRAVINRLLPIGRYNPGQALRDYSTSISNILEMERLAGVAVGLIVEAMDIQRGYLFLVDKEMDAAAQPCFRLRAVRAAGESPLPAGTLSQSSPVALALSRERHPVLQYDIDLLPVYQQAAVTERRWLSRLEAEVYVPIISKNEWIGMLALGAKTSGTRYSDDDLDVLTSLANQTAVALENARLVENLVRLNREIRQAYQALDNAARELERLDRTKSDFISIASHELRTPLTVLRGYSEMLLEDPVIKQSPAHRQTIEGIHKGTLRLHEIMDSMFDITGIEKNTIELHMQNIDMTELVQGVCRGLEKPIHDRKQALTIDLPSLPSIKADPNTLKKVFFHLIINAIKFTPNGGTISIGGRHLNPNQRDLPEGGVEIIVADTGVGVDPESRETIFTKFYQPEEDLNKHSSGKTKFKGSGAGLGLALSKGIVEAHGGRIWVESPGYDEVKFPGSQFHVVLPLRRQGESETVRMGSAVKMKL
jgi:signal transduction histidine kinase